MYEFVSLSVSVPACVLGRGEGGEGVVCMSVSVFVDKNMAQLVRQFDNYAGRKQLPREDERETPIVDRKEKRTEGEMKNSFNHI